MSGLPAGMTPDELGEAMERNKAEFWRLFKSLPGAEFHDGPDLAYLITGLPVMPLNGVFRARLDPDEPDLSISEILARFKALGVPALWWIGPSSRPAGLGHRLEALGLEHAEDVPAMAVDLSEVDLDGHAPDGLTIEPVGSEAGLRAYFQAWSRGFGLSEEVVSAFHEVYLDAGFGVDAPVRHYVGLKDGTPVATASLFMGRDVPEVFSVTTVSEARRQGIADAMTVSALSDAKDLGYSVGTLYSSAMGGTVYRELGFEEYFRIGVYELPAR